MRWARFVGRRPVAVVLLVVVALGSLAIPVMDLRLAFPSDSTASPETTQRKASDLGAEAFGPGRDAPLLVVVDGRKLGTTQERDAAYGDVVDWAAGLKGVRNAQMVVRTKRAPRPRPVRRSAPRASRRVPSDCWRASRSSASCRSS